MSVHINNKSCNLCGICIDICPGNLLLQKEDEVLIRAPEECWDCAACVKECPTQAIELYLPSEIGGRGATLRAKKEGNERIWTCKNPAGKINEYRIKIK